MPPSPLVMAPGISVVPRTRTGQPGMPLAGPTPELTAPIGKGKGMPVGAMPKPQQGLA
jgi:hypothetical protein